MPKGYEHRIGLERFKTLIKTMSVKEIAVLICEHYGSDEERGKCRACVPGIYRAKARVEAKERAKKTFDVIEHFEEIPEIETFIEAEKAKGVKDTTREGRVRMLKQIWTWVREDDSLARLQRPILWDIEVVRFILAKLSDMKIARYGYIQAFRQFFKSCGKYDLVKNPLLRARSKEMRAPGKKKHRREELYPEEFNQALEDEPLNVKALLWTGVTVGGRPGSYTPYESGLLGLAWDQVNWKERTINAYESKTGGGTWWTKCPLDLFSDQSFELLREYWKDQGAPEKGRIFPMSYPDLRELFKRIGKKIGRKTIPSDLRDTHATWLRELSMSDLAIGQYDALTGEAKGLGGVGWQNAQIFYSRYGKISPKKAEKMRRFVKQELEQELA